MTDYEVITTHDIRVGDVILNHGMRLLVDREPKQTNHRVTDYGGKTFATAALVLNWDEVQASGDRLLVGFIRDDMTATQWQPARYTEPRWTIQGNGLAQWARVIKEDN